MKPNETIKRTLHRSIRAALAATAVSVAVCGDAGAATLSPATDSTSHAMLLFAVTWFLASLRIRKVEGRWRFGFELSPVSGLAEPKAPMSSAQEGRHP